MGRDFKKEEKRSNCFLTSCIGICFLNDFQGGPLADSTFFWALFPPTPPSTIIMKMQDPLFQKAAKKYAVLNLRGNVRSSSSLAFLPSLSPPFFPSFLLSSSHTMCPRMTGQGSRLYKLNSLFFDVSQRAPYSQRIKLCICNSPSSAIVWENLTALLEAPWCSLINRFSPFPYNTL